ncbi:MAG: LuxR C-terminal-related transcriptional regulator, partial [Draconibacterium sp.]|nr:LuxR C-terminal-related transcriptional regulator [Draconibacterium sp.]
MQIEYIFYIATFIISAGFAVIGIMSSYQLYQTHQKTIFQILLYQQIFIFSFFIYGIWGNMAIREIISDFSLSTELANKLAIFIPVIGIPFMVVSWFMLLRFGFILNGYKTSKGFAISYFPIFISIVFTLALLLQKGIFQIPVNPDIFIIRVIVVLNFAVHFIFTTSFFKPKRNAPFIKETGLNKQLVLLYFVGVILYSGALSFYDLWGFISTCISIVLLFGVSIFIPVVLKINLYLQPKQSANPNLNFNEFCKMYEISKREAEIVLEICSGLSNKAISEKLFITIQTVKDHNHRIYTKTNVKSRVQLSNLVREKTGTTSKGDS